MVITISFFTLDSPFNNLYLVELQIIKIEHADIKLKGDQKLRNINTATHAAFLKQQAIPPKKKVSGNNFYMGLIVSH